MPHQRQPGSHLRKYICIKLHLFIVAHGVAHFPKTTAAAAAFAIGKSLALQRHAKFTIQRYIMFWVKMDWTHWRAKVRGYHKKKRFQGVVGREPGGIALFHPCCFRCVKGFGGRVSQCLLQVSPLDSTL